MEQRLKTEFIRNAVLKKALRWRSFFCRSAAGVQLYCDCSAAGVWLLRFPSPLLNGFGLSLADDSGRKPLVVAVSGKLRATGHFEVLGEIDLNFVSISVMDQTECADWGIPPESMNPITNKQELKRILK